MKKTLKLFVFFLACVAIALPIVSSCAHAEIVIQPSSGSSSAGVSSFSAGTTGLTPSSPGTGAVVLGGDLGIASGGTAATTASGARANLGAAILSDSARLPHWTEALYNVRYGLGYARFCAQGDSTTGGLNGSLAGQYDYSWPRQFGLMMVNIYGINAIEYSFWGSGLNIGTGTPNRTGLTVGSSWTSDTSNLSVGGYAYKATTSTNALAFNPQDAFGTAQSVDTFKIFYIQASGQGTMYEDVDGANSTTFSTTGSSAVGELTVTSTLATHTLNLKWSSGGQVDVIGVEAYDSTTPAVLIENFGTPSIQAFGGTGLSVTTNPWSPGNSTIYTAIGCNLTNLNIGINDENNGVSLGNYTTAVTTLLTNLPASGTIDVTFTTQNPTNPSFGGVAPYATQLEFMNAARGIANSDGLVIADIFRRWQTWAFAVQFGLYGTNSDPVHPSYSGYQDIAMNYLKAVVDAPGDSANYEMFTNSFFVNPTTGFVGLGWPAPAHKFQTNGAVEFDSLGTNNERALTLSSQSGSGSVDIAFTGDNTWFLGMARGTAPNGNFYLFDNGTGKYRWSVDRSTGYMGVNPASTTAVTAELEINGAPSDTAWGLNGKGLKIDAQTFTDSSSATGTVTNNMVNVINQPTLAATNTGLIYTNAATLYIANAPASGTNVTLTNPYALDVGAGTSIFGGGVTMTGLSSGTVASNSYIGLNSSNQLVLGSGGGGTITLGTSAAATNPQRSGQPGTGFYSATNQTVAVAANGVQAMQWNTVGSGVDYFSMTPGLSGTSPILSIAGSTTDQGFNIVPNGKGVITIGTTVPANSTALVDIEGNQGGSYFGYNFVVNSPSGYGGIGLYQGNTGSSSTKTGDIIVRNFSGNHLEFNSAGEIHMFNSLVVDPIGGFGNNFNGGLGTAFQVISAAGGNALSVNAVTNGVDGVQITNSIAANPGTATLSAVGSDTNIYLKFLSKGTGTVQIASHKSYLGTAPAVSVCGTSPTIDSQATDNSGTVTVGTVAAASCTVTFNVAYTNFVHCRISSQSTIASFAYSYTTSAMTVTGTSLVGDKFDYECDGQ